MCLTVPDEKTTGVWSPRNQRIVREIILRDFSKSNNLEALLKKIKENNVNGPAVRTMRVWWDHYSEYQELPYETAR